VVTMLLNCRPDGPRLKPYPDPDMDALRKKRVRCRLGKWDMFEEKKSIMDWSDSLYISKDGKYCHEAGSMMTTYTFYDSLGFIREQRRVDDVDVKFTVGYHFRDAHHLVKEQFWSKVQYWVDKSVVAPIIDTTVVIMTLNEEGQVVQEVDSANRLQTNFVYNESGMLREKFVKHSTPARERYYYHYNNNGDLKEIIQISKREQDVAQMTHYYSNGLLDSIVFPQGRARCIYRYVFYAVSK
jgi:hypothetical protein